MRDVANQDEARKCLEIASSNLQSGHLDKATRFAEKAMKLYPNDEARKILRNIRSKQGGTPSSSSAGPSANGSASAADLRRRTATASSSGRQEAKPEDRSTPAQRELVASILRKKSYYEVLGVEKDSNEDDIKRSYKKLALKLHPDKNTAPRSDEAFKAVSKAFSCLSDAQKRAAYDRYGEEEPGMSRTTSRGPFAGPGYDEFDPNEIFNMFFGGGFGGNRNAHVFNFGRGFPGQQNRAPPNADPPAFSHQLLTLLPVLLMLAFTFFAMRPSEPVFSIDRGGEFLKEMSTGRFNVPYYVKPSLDFDRTYPKGSRDRARIEQEVEVLYKERLDRQCYNERMAQQRLFRWGQSGKANKMPMPACKEIVDRFGNQYAYQSSIYGF